MRLMTTARVPLLLSIPVSVLESLFPSTVTLVQEAGKLINFPLNRAAQNHIETETRVYQNGL